MKKSVLKKLLSFLRPYMIWIILSIFFATLSILGTIFVPLLTKDIINLFVKGISSSFNWEKINQLLLIFVLFNVVVALTTWGMHICNNKITYSVVSDIRNEVFGHLQKMPLSYLDSTPSGDMVSRMIQDVEQLSDGLLLGFSGLFTGVLTIIGTIVIMVILNVYVALIVIVLTPLSLFTARFISKKTYHLFSKQSKEKGIQTAYLEEMIQNQKLVQAYGYEEKTIQIFDAQNEELRKTSLKAIFYSSLTNPSTRFINNMIYAAVGVFCAYLAISHQLLNVGEISAFLAYASQYSKPFNDISSILAELQNSFACAERVFELLEVPLEEEKEVGKVSKPFQTISFQSVSFSYQENQKVIEDFTFTIHQGQKVAIVGPTGCGKTTLINLLMRFYDVDEGGIYINGSNINDLPRKELRSIFGMVLQDTWLSSGTIKENLLFGREVDEEKMVEVAKITHCDNFIRKMENGYDTYLKESGGSLSQGQKQLLCIARVFLSDPSILILDEATSNIDTRTEQKVQLAFDQLMKGKTSFIVAHRLSTIQSADIILVMKDGKIIEQGKHEELFNKKGFYYDLYQSQFAK